MHRFLQKGMWMYIPAIIDKSNYNVIYVQTNSSIVKDVL